MLLGSSISCMNGWRAAHQHDLNFPMTIRHQANTLVYFGNATSEPQYQAGLEQQHVCRIIDTLRQQLCLDAIFYPKPVHGTDGLLIEADAVPEPRTKKCDYMMTSKPLIGLAIASADCLPIIYIDPEHRAIALAHAGWRGTADKIAATVVEQMAREFDSEPEKLHVIFGPSTRCFGELHADEAIKHGLDIDKESTVIKTPDGSLILDLSVLNQRQLVACGIDPEKIDRSCNICTKCDPQFCSHERETNNTQRQFSVVALMP